MVGGYDSSSPDVWSSPDGLTWTEETMDAGFRAGEFSAIVFNNLMWVFGGWIYQNGFVYKNEVWSSADGMTWTYRGNAQWTGREDPDVVLFNSR